MKPRVENKIALITGATSGIGEATAKLFVQEGATVIIADIDDIKGQQVAAAIGCEFLKLNVCEESEWEDVLKKIETRHRRLDILVNNAGIMATGGAGSSQNPEECSLENWRRIHAVNLDGVFLGCKHAIKLMKKNTHGSIVNVGSRSAFVGIPGACAYASSKAAVRNHTRSVALFCANADYGIRCNCLHPGPTITPLWEKVLNDPKTRDEAVVEIAQAIPLKRLATAEDIAYGILYFASDEASFATGTELLLDGGVLAGTAGVALKK